jgi:hypothetical protein
VTTPIDDLGDFAPLDPFFRIIEEGLAGLVDGGHFFELLAEDAGCWVFARPVSLARGHFC